MKNDYADYFGLQRQFDDPFLLPSNKAMPDTLQSALDLSLYLYYLNPNFQAASARVVRHFITDFDYPGDGSKQEKEDLDEFLHYQLQLPLFMAEGGDEYNTYGNGFFRMHFPFDRFLVDPRGGREYALDMFGSRARYVNQTMEYEVPDPTNPKVNIRMRFRDRKSMDPSRIKLRKLNPRRIIIEHNPFSGTSRFIYRFEPEIIADVKKGRLHIVNELPMAMLDAIRKDQDFRFDDDTVFHFRAPTVSGVSNAGWGMPPTIANFRNIFQLQVYRKLDEAVGLDYMLPFRIFSPTPQTGTNSDINNLLLGRWSNEIKKVIDRRRVDKFAMHSFPFPVTYQEFGAEGKELAPKDIMEFQTQTLFDGMGYPQELFKGTLQYLQVPNALRMFENSFLFVHIGFNNLAQWVVRRVRQYLNQAPIKITLQRPTLADSIERKQMIFQLASMGEISRETGYNDLGIDDAVAEMKKRMEEDAAIQREKLKMDSELQKEMETGSLQNLAQQEGQQQSGGGSLPGQADPSVNPQTPGNNQEDAQALAQYWGQLPLGQRRNAMQAARNAKPEVYALAKQMMEEQRESGAQQGRAAANDQMSQGGGANGGGTGGGAPQQ